ncbi:MAG: No hits [uncultured Sulfurovum sp.]|uniref:No hits n=1 Tax=uncultured Sulfurovum sp. TaxID=269237 RepID=A0A6S6UBL2_9BACT|nr:MAG: No hits [uncultured Sulfurovum sp.]
MLKKIIYMSIVFVSMLSSASVNTDKERYESNESIIVNYSEMEAQSSEWMAIYPASSSNDFGNIIQWKLSNADVNGSVTFEALSLGTYEVRVFNNADFLVSKQIVVEEDALTTTLETTKDIYLADEEIVAVFDNMSGNADDWIGIYPAGSSNAWENMLQWEWIEGGLVTGTQAFEAMPVGDYEVRVFFNNSFTEEAVYAFSVEAPVVLVDLAVSKNSYDPFELIHVEYNNMRGMSSDWIGIFSIGADHEKMNALEWRDAKSLVSGNLSFNGLIAGTYEVRSYFDNLHQETITFTVQDTVAVSTLYDDFEDGIIDPRWTRYAGPAMQILNVGANGTVHAQIQAAIAGQHSMRHTRDYRGGLNYAGYYFTFGEVDQKMKFLELDMRIGNSSHVFAFGVKIKTKFGDRRIEFASWLNHTLPSGQQVIRGPYGNVLEGHRQAFTQDNYLHVHPGPTDYYVGTRYGDFVHYKINIEEKLRVLEPDNELISITLFTTSGGDYDNLTLASH